MARHRYGISPNIAGPEPEGDDTSRWGKGSIGGLDMASAQSYEPNEETSLDQILLYLLGREAESRGGFKIPMSKTHEIVYAIRDDLEEMGIRLKFHKSVGDVHSHQVEEAVEDLIPYIIPISNPSFSLDVYDQVGENALSRSRKRLTEEQKEVLDRIIDDENYRDVLEEHIRNPRGR